MKYFITILALCIFSCTQTSETLTSGNNSSQGSSIKENAVNIDTSEIIDSSLKFSIQQVSFKIYKNALNTYKERMLFDVDVFGKLKAQIKLPLTNGYFIIKDTSSQEDETAEIKNEYIGQFPSIKKYVIHRTLYEGYDTELIDQVSGKNYSVWNVPRLSPNDRYLANVSEEYGMDGIPNGFQVWKVDAQNELQKYIEVDQNVWVPINLLWLDDQSFILKAIAIDKYLSQNKEAIKNPNYFYYIRVRLK